MIIRPIDASDFVAARKLLDYTFMSEGYTPAQHRSLLMDVAGRSLAPHTWTLVAADDHGLLGHVVMCRPPSPLVHLADRDDAEIRLLATAPNARRRGIATALLTACLDRARHAGCHRAVLATQAPMLTAQRLYTRLGFQRMPGCDQLWEGRQLLAYELAL